MRNADIAEIFRRMATLLDIQGENVFKVRAYIKAAENIESLSEDIEAIYKEGRLESIPGIGKALQEKIGEYLDTGKMGAYQELTRQIPESILDVIHVPTVGPKKAKLFYEELKVVDVEGLKKAARNKTLLKLPGIKEKTVENILKGITVVQKGQERMDVATASRVAKGIIEALEKLPEVKKISAAGSLRRLKETIRDIDILVASQKPEKISDVFIRLPHVKQVLSHGETKASLLMHENIQVDLRMVDENSWGAALLYFTGSKSFNIALRQRAVKKHMKVNEYGIFSVTGKKEKLLAGKTEKECFKVLKLPDIPPELREDIGEEELFKGKKVPALVEEKDIKGDFHVHSTWSDGHHTIKEIADAARKRGYQYIAVSDHSPLLRVTKTLAGDDIRKKRDEIERLNDSYKNFRILLGAEVEVDMKGNLDYNDKLLSAFDIVIAAVHVGFEQGRTALTKRIVKACTNKYVNILAHPFAFHLGKRDPIDIDFKEVCKAAAEHNTFLEINSFPVRLDLNSNNVYYAKKMGVKFAINTDAHRLEHFDFMKFGVGIARRGWLTKSQVLNTLSVKEVLKTTKK